MLDYLVVVLTLVAIFAIMSLSFNIQWGYAGLVNLSSITFVGVGASISAVVTLPPSPGGGDTYILGLQLPFLVAVGAAMLSSALLSLAIGVVALSRVRAHYFAIVTFCIAEIVHQIVGAETGLFNGFYGLYGIPQPFVAVIPGGPTVYTYFYLGLAILALVISFWFAERLRRSPFGRVLRAIREDENAVRAFGRNVFHLQLKAFVLGATLAGLAGALLAHYIGAFDPGGWTASETLLIFACVFLGGSGNNFGAVLGTVLILGLFVEGTRLIPTVLITNAQQGALQSAIIGALLILVLRFRPAGLLPERVPRDAESGELMVAK
jgi:branched-chain amino acid transport system permease protein